MEYTVYRIMSMSYYFGIEYVIDYYQTIFMDWVLFKCVFCFRHQTDWCVSKTNPPGLRSYFTTSSEDPLQL